MTEVERLAAFAAEVGWTELSPQVRETLKLRVLDSLGCAFGALRSPVVRSVQQYVEEMGGQPQATLIGGAATAPDRAALLNGAAVRYLDFSDAYLATGESCHPSDNLAVVLAAVEYVGGSGRDLLTALAIAYAVQCRLADEAPVRARGFDHVTHLAYSAAAAAARGLGLDASQIANAIAIAGTAGNALRVTRTGALSNWKGLAAPYAASCALQAAFLARAGITGPSQVFEGNKGFEQTIAGPFQIIWEPSGLERVLRTDTKRYNAEIHSQSTLEAVLELRHEHDLRGEEVDRVEIDVFDVAFNIIGGGEEGDKTRVRTKEEADHSIPYLVAVALLDGEVMPRQYLPDRILDPEVQDLLRRVVVRPDPDLSARFPQEHGCHVRILLREGSVLTREKRDYLGFHTRAAGWDVVGPKFEGLAAPVIGQPMCDEIVETVRHLDEIKVRDLCSLLARPIPMEESS
ncbi:MAG: MmgE/PrpD family protein [Candidatus Dormibacteraceae bacterium]